MYVLEKKTVFRCYLHNNNYYEDILTIRML